MLLGVASAGAETASRCCLLLRASRVAVVADAAEHVGSVVAFVASVVYLSGDDRAVDHAACAGPFVWVVELAGEVAVEDGGDDGAGPVAG
jgi:hypothetical protein